MTDLRKTDNSLTRPLLFVLVSSLLLKLAVWSVVVLSGVPEIDFTWADSRGYHEPAVTLLQSGRFDAFIETPGLPMTYRTPGYPLFLATVYRVLGVSIPAAVLIQAILSLVTIYLTWQLARKLWDERVAIFAAILLAVDPLSLTYSLKVMTESNFTLCIVIAVLAGANLVLSQRQRTGWALLLGVALAVATWTRPMSYYLPIPIVMGVVIWGWKRNWGWRTQLLAFLLIILPNVALIGGWTWRNYKTTGVSIYTSIEGYYAYFWQGANVIADREGIEIEQAQLQLGLGEGGPLERGSGYRLEHPETKDWNFEQLCVRWQKEGMAIITAHPLIFTKIYFTGVLRTLIRPGSTQLLAMLGVPDNAMNFRAAFRHPVVGLMMVYSYFYLLVLYLGFILYLVMGRRHDAPDIGRFFVLGVVLYILLVSGGPSATARFRIPLIPLLSLFSAFQIAQFGRKFIPLSARSI